MRALLILAAVPLVTLPLAACDIEFGNDDKPAIAGTGSGDARSYQAADFTKVELAGSDNVDVRIGDTFSVRAEGDSDLLDNLRIRREGDTLSVSRRNGFSWSGGKARIIVTMPRIVAGELAGSGSMTIDRVQGGDFSADSAGSGTIAVTALAADTVDIDIAGSGGFRGAGTAKRVKVDIAGSGSVDAAGLKASGADVSIAGSGDVKFLVAGDAKVSIMGSGDVDLGPDARCTVSKMGSGSVRCGSTTQ